MAKWVRTAAKWCTIRDARLHACMIIVNKSVLKAKQDKTRRIHLSQPWLASKADQTPRLSRLRHLSLANNMHNARIQMVTLLSRATMWECMHANIYVATMAMYAA